MKKTLEKLKQYFASLGDFFFRHIKQIPYILLYPVTAVINLLHSLTSYIYHWLNDSFGTLVTNQKRLTRLTRKAVRTVIGGHSNIMNSFASYRVSLVFTFLLQIISFLTTYAGFTFFLKNINPVAPLLLAIVVQGTFYFLINSRSTRKREGNWKRWLLLACALFLSTTTSFVGISNTVRNPVKDMKATFETYRTYHNERIAAHVNTASSEQYSVEQIQAVLDKCDTVLKNASVIRESLLNAMPSDDTIYVIEESMQPYGTDENGRTLYRRVRNTVINDEANKRKETITRLLGSVDSSLKQIYDDFGNPVAQQDAESICAVLNAGRLDEDSPIFRQFKIYLLDFSSLESVIAHAQEELQNGSATLFYSEINPDDFHLIDRAEMDEAVEMSQAAKIDDYATIVKSATVADPLPVKNFLDDLDLLLISPGLSQAETIRNALNEEMEVKYLALSSALQNELARKYNESQLPSSQLYPFRYLFNFSDPDWGSSVISLAIATAIDLLSFVLAFSLIKRRDSILYARNHRENVRNREEILEDSYTYLCLKKLPSVSKGNNIRTVAEIRTFVTKTIDDILFDFIKLVHVCYLPEELDSFGFISGSTVHKKFDQNLSDLFQTFRLIHLIHPTTKGELAEILSGSFPVSEKPKSVQSKNKSINSFESEKVSSFPKIEIDQLPDEVLYLVDNRLLMWYNESLSELFESTMISDEIGLKMQDETIISDSKAESSKQ